ncbi:hypothetical protein PtrSN002B_001097 [Pyrenophora tritici-repentis]|uniref:Tymo-45kd-70kd multi-domain protein n=2 Tax=Pyrenophora tritici-repentis TaxID=45151 RepID=A0A2W1G0Q5_9PLEO|nr:uncharacterized protein PTRG_05745 [Pyrenophora tritici-repentis Pt-1C-BFP]KAA8618833.1 hypothetical protein PtrV1_08262 [Pyrenophora tritici-repentis]EDU48665.1 conserved hypothetical protein [Pyrenophora tritici-repentis Pt-1C-BFP]KAF7449300.1 hypothetical protein A1F99_063490 [Pyrenophora tritici-repentis]KAF7570687.1 Tymo-45kd-70kd multi-domain protein [Pyrenophora tritici-repentis]KAG9383755.1 hypothetical protein A1F94_005666 [Pyrenophora tritici-repentis]
MRSFCQLAVLALPLFSTAVVASADDQAEKPSTLYASAQDVFQDLLNALPEESLQAALSGLKDFKNGVFESHHRGVEHVHSSNPALATKLIVDAVMDLRKRQAPQANNGTTTVTEAAASSPQSNSPPPQTEQASTPAATSNAPPAQSSNAPPTQSSQAPAESSAEPSKPQSNPGSTANAPTATVTTTAEKTTTAQRPALIPVVATVTQDGTTVVKTTEVLSAVTASVAVTVVRTNQQGSTVTQTENRPAVIKTVTDSAGRTTVTTSAANYAPTAGEVKTQTNEQGSTFLTTYTPGGGLVSSIQLITTTDSEGRPSTMTSYTFVDPIQATQTDDKTTATGKPSLQTGAAIKNAAQYAAVGVGAFAFFL